MRQCVESSSVVRSSLRSLTVLLLLESGTGPLVLQFLFVGPGQEQRLDASDGASILVEGVVLLREPDGFAGAQRDLRLALAGGEGDGSEDLLLADAA